MGGLKEEVWGSDEVRLSNLSRLTPEMPSCPVLVKLFLQDNPTLTMIPPAFFENMPVLEVLDLSCTSLQCLPPSISKLVSLQEFILKDCSLLMELPPEIGALTSLKLFDIEGTEMMYLPQEIGKLENMECLRVSLSAYAAEYGERKGIAAIVPRMTISKLTRLKELSISVSPEAEWWEKEVSEAILEELHVLPDLQALKLYLPTAEVLQQFLQLQSYRAPIYERLLNFRLIIGPYEQLTCSLPPCFEESFEKLDRCLKYINGGGSIGDVAEIVRSARSLFLCRHWTIERLSMFDLDKLKCCVLSECNEMQNLVDGEELHSGKVVLGSLQYLGIHYMKKLESIWRGPISRGCLTCLRILSLHSCPKLTTVFSSCVLDNLGSLTELIVEDCPKISCLISLELGRLTRGPFLPSLKKLSLLDLPELVGMSSGLRIAPDLDTLLVFNCLKLNLDTMELPNGSMKEIKGEVEWWDGLNCDRSNWNSIFVGLTRDGCLMDQLAEDTNSLQHFLELQMISPHPGSSLQKDHNPLQGQQGPFGVSHLQALSQVAAQAAQVHTQTDIQAEYSSLSAPLASSSPSQVQSCISNTTTHQGIPLKPDHNTAKDSSDLSNSDDRFPSSSITIDKCADDGHNWRKYGQKQVKGSEYLRSYYRCTHPNCPVLKKVELSLEGLVTEIIYKGQRDNQPPQSKPGKDTGNGASGQSEQGFEGQTGSFNHSRDRMVVSTMTIEDQDSGQASHEQSGSGDSEEVCNDVSRVDERHEDEAEARNRSREIRASEPVSSNLTFTGPRVSFQTIREVDHLDDGYKWRKYGQKPVLGSPYPRSYYKCTRKGCKMRKYVKRSAGDPKTVITTYEGEHNHDGPTAKNSSHNTANSTASQVNAHTGACLDGISLTKRPEVPKDQQQPMGLLQFKERTDNITVEEWLDL